jgi:serine O-acetyltransferase
MKPQSRVDISKIEPTNMIISSTEADWSREKIVIHRYEPGKYLLSTIRRYQRLRRQKGITARLAALVQVAFHRFWSAVSGADIPLDAEIGGGLLIPHPNGIVIHPHAKIGPNCLIFQQVTIGAGTGEGLPVIEGHVDIGAGAKIIGGVHIGAHARIGANAVVIDDVPGCSTAVGIPAKVRRAG